MSLTSFVGLSDVKARLKPFRCKASRKFGVPIKHEPRSKRYAIVGTAFDYLMRFELQRRAPHAVSERWVAEHALQLLSLGIDLLAEYAADPAQYMPPDKVAEQVRRILVEAKGAVARYIQDKSPTRASQLELAAHAIRLAKLDSVYRAMRLEPAFREAASEDVEDLVAMLAVVPFDDFLHPTLMLLNPAFGQTSLLVGGADTDLIAGDRLIDFKVTKRDGMEAGELDQLLGYFLLTRKHRSIDPAFPVINRLSLYYCRHAYLWTCDASDWLVHSEFPALETWFFQRANEVFPPKTAVRISSPPVK